MCFNIHKAGRAGGIDLEVVSAALGGETKVII